MPARARCAPQASVRTHGLPIPALSVQMVTFWKLVLMGRRLFARGFFAFDYVEEAAVKAFVDKAQWADRSFYLK